MIGNIPNGWKVEKLGNVFHVKDGTHDSPKYLDNGNGFPLITSKNIKNGKLVLENCNYISIEDFDKINKRSKVYIDDIIMPMIGTIGNPHLIIEEPNYAIKNVALFQPKKDMSKFLLHYLNSNTIKKKFLFDSNGGTQKFVSLTYLRNLPIPIPPLKQQQKIVKVLDISSSLIEKQKELIKNYDLFLKSKFIELFGCPIKNPMGWEFIEFGKVIEDLTDYHANGSYEILKKNVELLDKKDYALMVRTTDLEKNNFTDNVKYIKESAYHFLKKTKVFGNEIIMNKIGSAGSVFLMPSLDINVSLGMNLFLIRLNTTVNEVFIFNLLETEYGKKSIEKKVRGAVTKSITKDAVREIKIFLPPIELQNKFALIVEKIEVIKEKENKKLKSLEDLHNSLMQKAFKGEIE